MIGMAALFVAPAFGYLYWLQQHGRLTQSSSSEELRRAAAAQHAAERPTPEPGRKANPVVATAVFATAAAGLLRDLFRRRR